MDEYNKDNKNSNIDVLKDDILTYRKVIWKSRKINKK